MRSEINPVSKARAIPGRLKETMIGIARMVIFLAGRFAIKDGGYGHQRVPAPISEKVDHLQIS